MMPLLQAGQFGVSRRASAGGGATYLSVVSASSPDLWYRMDDAASASSSVLDSGTPGTNTGTIGTRLDDAGLRVTAPAGYAGILGGFDFTKFGDLRCTPTAASYIGDAGNAFGVFMWMTGSPGGGQYVASRVNNAAVIYGFVADTVEFFSIGYSGSNPRTGSQISLPSSDTSTPHLIGYVYDGTTFKGYKDGVQVFSNTMTFSLPSSTALYIGSDSSGNEYTGKMYDFMAFRGRAPSAAEISSWYAARNLS